MAFHDGLAQTFGNARRVVRGAILQQHAEFVATQARQRIALAQAALQNRAHLAHQLISGGMAAGIVDHLELVEVKIHHRMVTPELRGALQGQIQPAFELAAVDEAGQGIVTGLIGKLGDVLAFAAHIMKYQHHTGNITAAIAAARPNWRTGEHDRNLGAVVADQQHGRGRANRTLLAQYHLDGIRRKLPAAFVYHAQHVAHRQAPRLRCRPPGELLGNRVQIFDPAVGVSGNDAIGDGCQRYQRAFLLGKQIRGRLLAIRHVRNRSCHADCLAGYPAHRLAAGAEPAVIARLGLQANFDIERCAVFEVVGNRVVDFHPVFGMHSRHQPVHRIAEFTLVVPQQLLESRRVIHFTGDDVPVPQTVVAAGHGQVEALLAQLQRLFGLFPMPDHAAGKQNADGNEYSRCGKVGDE